MIELHIYQPVNEWVIDLKKYRISGLEIVSMRVQ